MKDGLLVEIPRAYLKANHPLSRRDVADKRPFPLNEAAMPRRQPGASPAQKRAELKGIADWLAVDRSARYQPTGSSTYCNIYAADYCYLADVYLPRVWWTDKALASITAGQQLEARYDVNVYELSANALNQWLPDYGPAFGWRKTKDAAVLQDAVNQGGVGVICARRTDPAKSGHITVVIAEDDGHLAKRTDGVVIQPLQSQAGSRNFRYGSAGDNWWRGQQFADSVLFVHD